MKNTDKLFNLLTAFTATIGLCVASLVCFIIIYTNINGPFPQKQTIPPTLNIQSVQTDVQNVDTEIPLPNANDFPSHTASMNPKNVASGKYDINGVEFWFNDSVVNDGTGRWRISSIASSLDITEYAVNYYNTLFSSDDEIHAIINFSLNTTTSISVLYDGMLDVTIHEYVDGEEHDAKVLFGGMLLEEYWVNIETGEIEKIQ